MPLWGANNTLLSDKPKFPMAPYNGMEFGANGIANNANVYGITVSELANTGNGIVANNVVAPGWVTIARGRGNVMSFSVNDGGLGYAANDWIAFTGGGAITQANGKVATVNANGSILTVALNSGGAGYNTHPTIAAVNTGNVTSAATFNTPTMGGRFGRVHTETLVAFSSMVGDDTTDDAFAPGT